MTCEVKLPDRCQYGDTLTAEVTVAPEGVELVYSFYRTENGEKEELVQTGDSNQYKVTANDVGYWISVKVEGYAEESEALRSLSSSIRRMMK